MASGDTPPPGVLQRATNTVQGEDVVLLVSPCAIQQSPEIAPKIVRNSTFKAVLTTQGEDSCVMRAGSGEKDDIAAQLGVGSAASDAELDRLKDATEAEILARNNLIGRFAPLVAAFCHQR